MVGPAGPDENTFFIGQSIGCLVILRYLACLPPGFKIGGCLFVGCWLSLDHTTQRRRSPAIDDLIRTEWDTFKEGWMNHNDVDFAV
ncbi:hypothetical protein NSK_008642 [Nannochloropsis salina CCMP1776]|uniref:Uncharacterized protein n=1 Tax=Nannochloropsis salina CCMP1776 TaxID=1027361 RepID=A0A4D9CNJ0_9STRA|nr:hypothetical protein NSK_008642 [Nannochloropsis salina CCMP1776]|eukprot:TFJ80084.1 hypothetical protein NSK_008642 [Nannochloropsis salina CCMP1776]